MIEIGFDIGGTFVDLCIKYRDRWHYSKVLIDAGIERAAMRALDLALADAGVLSSSDVSFLAHGTTIATNVLIEGTGAHVGLITTRGFRDILEIGRQDRPHLYDSRVPRPTPLVPRNLRVEVDERIGPTGEIRKPLDIDSVSAAIQVLRTANVGAVAICLLHAWVNPVHEMEVAKYLREQLPELPVYISSVLAARYGEYERTSTTVVSAYVGPSLGRYLRSLETTLTEQSVSAPMWVMQSNGGLGSVEEVLAHPTRAQSSGPAAGVIGAAAAATAVQTRRFVALDIGGTSSDVTLVTEDGWQILHERSVRGQPVLGDAMAVSSIGAGGGSIAWIDPGGLLKVGPRSAAASPGPACYGRGGKQATLTDALLVLGYISESRPLARELVLDVEAARSAISALGSKLGMSLDDTAAGIIEVAIVNIVRAVRKVTVEAGHDPEQHALVAYGGGGPLLANLLVRELGIRKAIIPPAAGVLSAVGLLSAGPRLDVSQSCLTRMDGAHRTELWPRLNTHSKEATLRLVNAGVPPDSLSVRLEIDLCYVGQSHQLSIPVDMHNGAKDEALTAAVAQFHEEHRRLFGVAAPGEPVECVMSRAIVESPRHRVVYEESGRTKRRALSRSTRRWRTPEASVDAHVYERNELQEGTVVEGPALIDSDDTTVAILPGYLAEIRKRRILVISSSTRGQEQSRVRRSV